MSSLRLLLAEIRFRKLNFLLGLLAVTSAAALFVAGPSLIDAYRAKAADDLAAADQERAAAMGAIDGELAALDKTTKRAMRDLGFNLRIVHKDTNLGDFWAADFALADMPDEFIRRLAESPDLVHVRHLVATLQQRIKWRDMQVLLIGYEKETPQKYFEDKSPMGHVVPPGKVLLGYQLWKSAEPDLKVGDKIEILGRSFTVAKTFDEQGSLEDNSLVVNLHDAQRILNKPRRVNEILALSCECDEDRLPTIRGEITKALGDEVYVQEDVTRAVARAEQRAAVESRKAAVSAVHDEVRQDMQADRAEMLDTMRTLATVVTPLVIFVCGLWVGLLALTNVRERSGEIGLMRALGKPSSRIAGLFLGRAALIGLAGGAIGLVLGTLLAEQLGARLFDVSHAQAAPQTASIILTLLGAPLLCSLAAWLPTLRAIVQDPAVVLRDA